MQLRLHLARHADLPVGAHQHLQRAGLGRDVHGNARHALIGLAPAQPARARERAAVLRCGRAVAAEAGNARVAAAPALQAEFGDVELIAAQCGAQLAALQVDPIDDGTHGQAVGAQRAGPAGGVAGARKGGVGVEGAAHAPARWSQGRPHAHIGKAGAHGGGQRSIGRPGDTRQCVAPRRRVAQGEAGVGGGIHITGAVAGPEQARAQGVAFGLQRQFGLAHAGRAAGLRGGDGGGAARAGALARALQHRDRGSFAGEDAQVAIGAPQAGLGAQRGTGIHVPLALQHHVAPQAQAGQQRLGRFASHRGRAFQPQRIQPCKGQAFQAALALQAHCRAGPGLVARGLPLQRHAAGQRAGKAGLARRSLQRHRARCGGWLAQLRRQGQGLQQLQCPGAGALGVLRLHTQLVHLRFPQRGGCQPARDARAQRGLQCARAQRAVQCQRGLPQRTRQFCPQRLQLHSGRRRCVARRQGQVELRCGQRGLQGERGFVRGRRRACPGSLQLLCQALPAAGPAAGQLRLALDRGSLQGRGQARQAG